MKKLRHYTLLLLLLQVLSVSGQKDSINVLEEVLIDAKLNVFSTGQTVLSIPDSITKRSRPLLASILKYNTPVYFKENGLGMVSSPSFRGTSASQTAVLWNGININSQFNGQTDFNAINAGGYDEIAVRGGGGSVVYGTGAIGGTVHLNTHLSFRKKLENDVFVQYGSFNTLDARYQLEAATGDWSITVSGARNSSDNDYEYADNKGENINGDFYSNSFNLGLAYRVNNRNTIRFYSELFDGERHFSLIRPSDTKTKYQNLNNRNLLEWESELSRFTSTVKLAFLDENYKYFGNIAFENHTFGEADTFIAKYDLKFEASEYIQLNTVLTNTYNSGKGSSVGQANRNIFSAAFLMKHWLNEKLSYEAGVRTEITDNYESPVLFSVGTNYRFFDWYSLKLNASRNFRIPTFNDLYWSSSGNTDLAAEASLQGEIGNRFTWQDIELNLTAYYIDIEDMIRWIPESGGLWRPENVDEVNTYGLEALLGWKKQLENYGFINFRSTYAYTISKNKQTKNYLTFVPKHKATAAIDYSYNRWAIDYQFLFNGEVYTRSNNDTRYNLNSYSVSNLGISYELGKEHNYRVGGRVLNLFDIAYESVENRWMPGINFNIYLNFNF
ncbi:TonB-dependent receptor [Salinimicrobium marinum]|uniref:TonB-dependent receptor n=1 Tax=Salinimicrobium marinum TaxID=680283 RepID=A0A918SDL6_9FLAO|nr:TonB-dependent receptor [Salinimicrobium marinum]GHA34933.1 TonB-dependent receptor [Salinimicrobium marinum]